jgi:Zn-dependent protease
MSNISSIIQIISISAIPILFAIILHEVAHGWVADKKGDPTARMMGRLTLNPLVHIDPIGTIIVPILLIVTKAGFVFGWAKPVPVNFLNLRRPKEDMIWVAAAGPGTNLLLALACGLLFRLMTTLNPSMINHICFGSRQTGDSSPVNLLLVPLLLMLVEGVKWNVVLAIFNMIPIPPLDGGRVMVGLLPERQAATWSSLEPFGFFIVIGLFMLNPLGIMSQIVYPLMINLMTFIGGSGFTLVLMCR